MKNVVLAITSFNRKDYLKECLSTWDKTRSRAYKWSVIIADDGSSDGTLEYLEQLSFDNCTITVIKNNRIGVHQQMNTILTHLESIDFDFCFKIDDDITFLKPGWDQKYYHTAIESGYHHLVFCDENWSTEQFLEQPKTKDHLVGKVPMLHAHGFFYTLTPEILEKVGYMDATTFGYRGMGHVDYTARCARAGFTDKDAPWDIKNSNDYISATKHNYKSVIPNVATSVYDSFNRERKENVIIDKNRIYVELQETDQTIYPKFREAMIEAFVDKVEHFEQEKKELINWYESEITKIDSWHNAQYSHLPKWHLKMGKFFKLFKSSNESKT